MGLKLTGMGRMGLEVTGTGRDGVGSDGDGQGSGSTFVPVQFSTVRLQCTRVSLKFIGCVYCLCRLLG